MAVGKRQILIMKVMTARTSCMGSRLCVWFEISQNNYLN